MNDGLFWFLFLIGYSLINYPISIWGYKKRLKRRKTKFLNAVKVKFPGGTYTLISLETSDEASMDKLERQIRES